MLLRERKSRTNVRSASIRELTSRCWRRIIDSPHRLRGGLLKGLPFLQNFLILLLRHLFSSFASLLPRHIASSSSSWSSSRPYLFRLGHHLSSFPSFSQISPYPFFFSFLLIVEFYESLTI